MGRRFAIFFLLVIGSVVTGGRDSAAISPPNQTLTFAGDVWCPINCDPEAEKLGLGVDLLKQIYEPLGYHINYVVMPWARAVEQARTGAIDGVIGALKEDAPGLLFPDEPLLGITDDFYVRSDSPLTYLDPQSLKGAHIGTIYDYSYAPAVTALLDENAAIPGGIQSVGGDDALEQNIRKLLAGRITVLCESSVVMNYTLRQMQLENQIKWLGGNISSGKIYIAFSPASDRTVEVRRLYDTGVARLRRANTLLSVYDTYALRYGQHDGADTEPTASEGP